MKKIKGPNLKMPELKLPQVFRDLYEDLRDRRLLPLVALVLVAIVAVPFLLSSGSEPKPVTVKPAPKPAGASASALTVVRATPGIRDYRKRLKGRTPTDPFKVREKAPDLTGAQLGSPGDNGFEQSQVTTTTSSGTTVTKETTKSSGGETTTKKETEVVVPPQEEGGEQGNGGDQPSEQVNLYSFAVDVKVTRIEEEPESHKTTKKSQTRNEVLAPAPLPGEKEQAVTYLGISPKTKNPLLLVSDAVTSVFGEATCLSGESKCQLLEVETGMPMTYVLGEGRVRVKINILAVKPVLRGHY